jgi:putative transposase
MTSTKRTQRRYDHRLQQLVQTTGNIRLATQHGVPESTARGWLTKSPADVVSIDVLDLDAVQRQREVIQLRRRITTLTALVRLAIVVLRVAEFSLNRIRLADGSDKRRLMRAIGRTRSHISLRIVLRAIGLSRARYHDWGNDDRCALDDRSSCPRNSPHQLTRDEVNTIREMVTSQEYRHVPTCCPYQ